MTNIENSNPSWSHISLFYCHQLECLHFELAKDKWLKRTYGENIFNIYDPSAP